MKARKLLFKFSNAKTLVQTVGRLGLVHEGTSEFDNVGYSWSGHQNLNSDLCV